MKILVWIPVFSAAMSAQAQAAILSIGGPRATSCYEAAAGNDSRPENIQTCTLALNEDSLTARDRVATYVNRGILLMGSDRFAAADADFDAALTLDSGLPDGWLNKGFLRLRQGLGRDALPLIQKAIELGAPKPALAVFARGVAYEQMGEFRSAYADLKRARELAPGWSLPRDYLATYRVETR